MGYASGWRRTEGPQAGEWFLNAYYYSFDATGVDAIDELLSAVAYAGKRYHGTDMWTEPTEDEDGKPGPSSVDEIQMAAQRAAAQLAEARAEIESLTIANGWLRDSVENWRETVKQHKARIAELDHMVDRLIEQAISRDARIAELEADVVWVARVGICQFVNGENVLFTMTTPTIFMRHDGTPADILRAVREARDGVS